MKNPQISLLDRSNNISNLLTEMVYRYINRILYTKDRGLFALNVGLRIKLIDGVIKPQDIVLLTKAGAMSEEKGKYGQQWLDDRTATNLKALLKHKFGAESTAFFKDIMEKIPANEDAWKKMKSTVSPECFSKSK